MKKRTGVVVVVLGVVLGLVAVGVVGVMLLSSPDPDEVVRQHFPQLWDATTSPLSVESCDAVDPTPPAEEAYRCEVVHAADSRSYAALTLHLREGVLMRVGWVWQAFAMDDGSPSAERSRWAAAIAGHALGLRLQEAADRMRVYTEAGLPTAGWDSATQAAGQLVVWTTACIVDPEQAAAQIHRSYGPFKIYGECFTDSSGVTIAAIVESTALPPPPPPPIDLILAALDQEDDSDPRDAAKPEEVVPEPDVADEDDEYDGVVPRYQPPSNARCEPSRDVTTLQGVVLSEALADVRQGHLPEEEWRDFVDSCEVSRADVSGAFNQGGLRAHRNGDYTTAVVMWSTAVTVDPSRLAARYNLACGFALLGNQDGALTQLREVARAGDEAERWMRRAMEDEDLASLRDDPEFRAIVGGR